MGNKMWLNSTNIVLPSLNITESGKPFTLHFIILRTYQPFDFAYFKHEACILLSNIHLKCKVFLLRNRLMYFLA